MFFTLIFGDNFFITNFSKLCFGMKVVEKNLRQFLQMVPLSKMLQLTLRIDALFEIFIKAQVNNDKYISQKTTLCRPNSLTKEMDGLFKYIDNRA